MKKLLYQSSFILTAFLILYSCSSPEEETQADSKKKEKWDPIRFLSQSSKFVSFPKPPLPGMNRPIQVSPGEVVWSSSNTGTSIGKLRKFQFAPLDEFWRDDDES